MAQRIHIFGASGAGTSTLGSILAARLNVLHLDADDFYWMPTDPPFRTKRAPESRVALIRDQVAGPGGWVLSGSICSWGDPLLELFTLAVFLQLNPNTRMDRLREREAVRFGARIQSGGDMYEQHREFMEWAQSYDDGKAPLRSLDLHERWMKRLGCPVIRLDAEVSAEGLAEEVLDRIAA